MTTADQAKPKRKMRPGGGKAKGAGYEGTIAKKLTAALQPLNFMRTPGSGARVGGKNFATIGQLLGEDALKIFVGDVVPVNERQQNVRFHFSIECKFYATQDHFTSLVAGSANVFKWFDEAVVDAAKIDKRPMLIFKWNHTPNFVAISGPTAVQPALTISNSTHTLHIYELDALLTDQAFWFSSTQPL